MAYEFYATREDPSFKNFQVTPVGGALGAELTDIDLSKVLGIAKHRLGTPITSMLDDEISVS